MQSQRVLLVFCLSLFFAASCGYPTDNATTSPLDPWQEKQVLYRLVLAMLDHDQMPLVVDELSDAFHQEEEQLAQLFPTADPATLRAWVLANQQRQALHPVFARDTSVTLIDRNPLMDQSSGMITLSFALERFRSRYPAATGLILLSDIGFNQAHSEALITVELLQSSVSGKVNLFLLRKVDGQWTIIEQKATQWIV